VATNPPFSLFREYVAQLDEHGKQFVIIGNKNAINYKEVFKLIMENKLWIGNTPMGTDMLFDVPEDFAKELAANKKEGSAYKIVDGVVKGRSQAIWFTNLGVRKRHEELTLYVRYTPEQFFMYDNYDAIEVSKVVEIPMDYDGVMGVPITFLDKYNPKQFEILGLSQKVGYGLQSTKLYDNYREVRQDGSETGSSGKKTNGNPVMEGRPEKGNYYYDGTNYAYSLYGRIFIKRIKPQT
jgi:hypothetical protein